MPDFCPPGRKVWLGSSASSRQSWLCPLLQEAIKWHQLAAAVEIERDTLRSRADVKVSLRGRSVCP